MNQVLAHRPLGYTTANDFPNVTPLLSVFSIIGSLINLYIAPQTHRI